VWGWAHFRGIKIFARDGTGLGGLLAGALFGAEFLCIFIGLQYTTASRMVVFIYISPFVVALGMPLIARSERLVQLQIAGLLVAFAGVAWAFAEGFSRPAAGPRQSLGDGLGVLAGVLWGATTLAIRGSALGQASAEKTLFYQLAISGALQRRRNVGQDMAKHADDRQRHQRDDYGVENVRHGGVAVRSAYDGRQRHPVKEKRAQQSRAQDAGDHE